MSREPLTATATPPDPALQRAFWAEVRRRHPRFRVAVAADARLTARRRGDRWEFRGRLDTAVQVLRLAVVTETFFGQCCYRAKARLQALGVPVVPRILNHLAVGHGGIAIGDPVIVAPGVFIPHGQVVIDGITEIGTGVVISPFVTVGLRAGELRGPTIGDQVELGTGAKVLGPWRIGTGARIGANAVVVSDIAAGASAVGVPARELS